MFKKSDKLRIQIRLTGQVQGVGCRPFVYQQACRQGLGGWVRNDTQGVLIEAQGGREDVERFLSEMQRPDNLPAMMRIDGLKWIEIPLVPSEQAFAIISSDHTGVPSLRVCADIAVCSDCLRELNDPSDFRYHYPFINCTQCGPRYSIVKTVPYDRSNTTMAAFAMCPACLRQYQDVADRRFHAQPVACPACGPNLWLADNTGNVIEADSDCAIEKTALAIKQGKILAIKGIGGFHLACDALNESAVAELRSRKHREAKPFAMMAARSTIERYAHLDQTSRELLTSPQAPIVLLPQKTPNPIAASVASGVHRLGIMLPYAPLHHLLFAHPQMEALVMTSANIADEPLICDNDRAVAELTGIADLFLMHNRPIYRQIDDSVMHVVDGRAAFLRRARGYVPSPILRSSPVDKPVLAVGADLKNTFCLAKGNQYLVSEHIGDIENPAVFRHFARSIDHLAGLFEIEPKAIVHDLHPGYLSTQFAHDYARRHGIQHIVAVQHHWAHAASVMAEYGIEGQVIALIADGTGYGTDGAVWGGECLIASLAQFHRFAHIDYYPLAGGDAAAKEPLRPLLGLLRQGGYDLSGWMEYLAPLQSAPTQIETIWTQLDRRFNTAQTSSLGRLFDAVAGLIGLGQANRFEAELPMRLESIAAGNVDDFYPPQLIAASDGQWLWQTPPLLEQIRDDLRKKMPIDVISATFHNTVCQSFLTFARKAREQTGLNGVVLAGGVFCNGYLADNLLYLLRKDGFTAFFKTQIPANDGGISLGQAAIAASRIDREFSRI